MIVERKFTIKERKVDNLQVTKAALENRKRE